MRADRQTAGYGRRGRAWQSPLGNLAATLLWPLAEPLGADGPAAFGFAAALAIRDAAIAAGTAPERLTLKWPNDVLLGGIKLSGLLIEFLDGPQRALAIGIGVNLAHAPQVEPYDTAALPNAPSPDAFLASLDAAFISRVTAWRTDGMAVLRDAWLAAAQGLGEAITVRLPNEVREGVFEGLGPTGGLQLRDEAGLTEVTVGDVFFSSAPAKGGAHR